MVSYGFHPDALIEYREATDYYVREASPAVAERFVATGGIWYRDAARCPGSLARSGHAWDSPLRRPALSLLALLSLGQGAGTVTVFAVMHSNREPGYWKGRIG